MAITQSTEHHPSTSQPALVDGAGEVVLFNISDRYFLDFAVRLQCRGARIHSIVSARPEQVLARPELAKIAVVDNRQFKYPEQVLALNEGVADCLSAEVIARFAPVENTFLSMTDRMSYRPATVRFRVRLFRALLQYWLRFFTATAGRVTTTFHISAPHMGWDLVAFHAAKQLGVQTLFLERTLIENRVLLLDDYARIEKVPGDFLADRSSAELAGAVDSALLAAVKRPSSWSKYSAKINETILGKRRGKSVQEWKQLAARALSGHWPKKLLAVTRNLASETPGSALLLSGPVPNYRVRLQGVIYRQRLRELRSLYDELARPAEDVPYILFALHLQPERSTCPQGGVYDDQLLAVETLAKAVAPGYRVYVKEHPRQFWPTFLKARHYRDEHFYRSLSAMANVQLLPLAAATEPLITRALATATITGSAGWESLLRSKPCLAFGTPWYVSCNSCHAVRSLEDCRRAVSACAAATPSSVERDLLTFLAFMQRRLIYASNGARFSSGAADYDVLVDNLAGAVASHLASGSSARLD